jgi:predicted esterase
VIVDTPDRPSISECNPAAARWRNLVIDPDLAGLVPARARPSSIRITCGDHREEWRLPLDDVLPTRLAWHPRRPLVAGLAVRNHRAHVWIADYRARTVVLHENLRAAISFTGYGDPPVAWCDDDRLALLVPVLHAPAASVPSGRPVVFEASGPGQVSFAQPPAELEQLAGARLAVVDLGHGLAPDSGEVVLLTPPLLVRSLLPAPTGRAVMVSHGRWSGDGPDIEGLRWVDALVDLDAPGRLFPVPEGHHVPPVVGSEPGRAAEQLTEPARTTVSIPTGFGSAPLVLPPAEAPSGPLLLWIRAFPPGENTPCPAPTELSAAGHPVATLDLPVHWPSDATLDMLRSQIVGAVESARKHWDGSVVVGGHSFGATLALYALAHIPDLVSAIAHSGCYNRTLTPTGFHYEKRPYWAVPEIYHAFSALHFADRLDRPVMLVHGAEDGNPATPPEQAVELYRAIVAAGGRARLVLLPHEGHDFRYRETHEVLGREHRDWLGR